MLTTSTYGTTDNYIAPVPSCWVSNCCGPGWATMSNHLFPLDDTLCAVWWSKLSAEKACCEIGHEWAYATGYLTGGAAVWHHA